MIQVLKRNGKIVDFDPSKIIGAIEKAYKDIYNKDEMPNYAAKIADDIALVALDNDNILAVEEIQELVEDFLTEYDLLVAKAYIRYRYKKEVARNFQHDFIDAIREKLNADDVQN